MNSLKNYLCSSVGKKQLVALTGLGMSGFVLMHMAANMLIIFNPEAYNKYGHAMVSNPLLPVAEIILVVLLVIHVLVTLQLTYTNGRARPISPAKRATCVKDARFGSKSMIYTGILTFAFLGLHLWTFKYGTYYSVTYDGVEMRDLHRLVVEKFSEPLYFAWYVFAVLALGVHLSHGFSALFQSLGLASVRSCAWKKAGYAFAGLIAFGFISQPVWVFLWGGHRS